MHRNPDSRHTKELLELLSDLSHARLGLFVLGCSPGGTGSNFWTLLLDGDINMSITMTFMSTMLALGFMPLWIFTLGEGKCAQIFKDLQWIRSSLDLQSMMVISLVQHDPTIILIWNQYTFLTIRRGTLGLQGLHVSLRFG